MPFALVKSSDLASNTINAANFSQLILTNFILFNYTLLRTYCI